MGIIGFLWTWHFLPDTKGRSLEELDELFLNVRNPNLFDDDDLDAHRCDRKYPSKIGKIINAPVMFKTVQSQHRVAPAGFLKTLDTHTASGFCSIPCSGNGN